MQFADFCVSLSAPPYQTVNINENIAQSYCRKVLFYIQLLYCLLVSFLSWKQFEIKCSGKHIYACSEQYSALNLAFTILFSIQVISWILLSLFLLNLNLKHSNVYKKYLQYNKLLFTNGKNAVFLCFSLAVLKLWDWGTQ